MRVEYEALWALMPNRGRYQDENSSKITGDLDWGYLNRKLGLARGIFHLPESFGSLTITGNCYLNGNKFEYLPRSFGSVKIGGDLVLWGNGLSSLPASFSSLSIRNCDLSYNNLATLPDNFGELAVSQILNLHSNPLVSVPRGFGWRVEGDVIGVDPAVWKWGDDY